MRQAHRLLIIMGLLILLLAGVTPAQPPGAGGSQASHPGPALYDPQTVATVAGIVVAAPAAAPRSALPEPAHLTLKTDQGPLVVLLGPAWFIDQQGLKITALNHLEVTGSKISLQGKPAMVAGQIKKGDQILKLRNANGAPLWGGRGKN